jgi:hypothetical protein
MEIPGSTEFWPAEFQSSKSIRVQDIGCSTPYAVRGFCCY